MATPRIAWGGKGWWLGRDGQFYFVGPDSQHVFFLEKHPDLFGYTPSDVRNDVALERVYDAVVTTWCKVRMLNGRIDFSLPVWDRVWLRRIQEAVTQVETIPTRILIFLQGHPNQEIDTDFASLVHAKSFPHLEKGVRIFAGKSVTRPPNSRKRSMNTTTRRIAWGGKGYWLGEDGSLVDVGDDSQHIYFLQDHPEMFGLDPHALQDSSDLMRAYDQVARTWARVRILHGEVDFNVPALDAAWLQRAQNVVERFAPHAGRVVFAQAHNHHNVVVTDGDTFREARSVAYLQKRQLVGRRESCV